jgi:hypothetical protein
MSHRVFALSPLPLPQRGRRHHCRRSSTPEFGRRLARGAIIGSIATAVVWTWIAIVTSYTIYTVGVGFMNVVAVSHDVHRQRRRRLCRQRCVQAWKSKERNGKKEYMSGRLMALASND